MTSVLESQLVQRLLVEVKAWRVRYVDQGKFGSLAAENTSAWIVDICPRDTMAAVDLSGHNRRKRP